MAKYNILKAASWYTIGNILIKGVSFFVLPVFTRLMSTHEYGIYSVYLSYLNIYETVILLGLSATVAVAKYAKEVEFESYISTILTIPTAITGVIIVLVNICVSLFGNILSMNAPLWNCLLITSAAGAIGGIIGARLVIDGRYMLYLAYSGIATIGNVLISLMLCYTIYKDHDVHLARIYGSTIASVISVVFLIIVTKVRFRLNRKNVKYAFAWGIPLLFHTVATVVLMQSDRILVRYLDSYSSAGIYAVATTIVTIPMVLQQSLHQAWTPWFYGKLETKDYKQIQWLNDRYIMLYGVIIGGFMLISPDIIHMFTERNYWPCVYSLVPLSIGVFAELLYGIPASVEYYNKKTTYIMTATLITVILNILLDILFIKTIGYHGAAYATAFSKIFLFLLHLHFSRKLDRNEIFSKQVVIISIGALALLNAITVMLEDNMIIRYGVLILLVIPVAVYLLKKRKIIFNQMKENC